MEKKEKKIPVSRSKSAFKERERERKEKERAEREKAKAVMEENLADENETQENETEYSTEEFTEEESTEEESTEEETTEEAELEGVEESFYANASLNTDSKVYSGWKKDSSELVTLPAGSYVYITSVVCVEDAVHTANTAARKRNLRFFSVLFKIRI